MAYVQFVENGIRFNEDGIGRKNGLRFEMKYGEYLNGERQDNRVYLRLEDKKNGIVTYTEMTHRFPSIEEAAKFCEKIIRGELTVEEVKAGETQAWVTYNANAHVAAEKELLTFAQKIQKIGISVEAGLDIISAYHTLSSRALRLLSHDSMQQHLSMQVPPPERKIGITLGQYLDIDQNDIDICIVDLDSGEHPQPCLCYLSPEDLRKPDVEYSPIEQWMLSLPLDRIQRIEGFPIAVLKADFSCDELSFLLEESEYATQKWGNLASRAYFAEATFDQRLAFLEEDTAFETPFDATCMDALDPVDRDVICRMLNTCKYVNIVSSGDRQYVYGLKEDPFDGALWTDFPEVAIQQTAPGQGLVSSLPGKLSWSEYQKNSMNTHISMRDAPEKTEEFEL